VVLDAAVLTTGSQAVRSVWVAPGCQETPETAQLAAHALLSRADRGSPAAAVPTPRPDQDAAAAAGQVRVRRPATTGPSRPAQSARPVRSARPARSGAGPGPRPARPAAGTSAGPAAGPGPGPARRPGTARTARWRDWRLMDVPPDAPEAIRRAAGRRSADGRPLALWHADDLVGLVEVEPELDPLAMPLIAAAREAGSVVIGGRGGIGPRARVDQMVAGGSSLARSVRELQASGRAVALVSARQHAALAAADLGIGVPDRTRAPWGAHLITGYGLADACRVLEAIGTAKTVSRRAATFAAYGSGAGGVLALAGLRSGAAARSLLAVNGAALAALGSGVWSAMTLARRPEPLPAETTSWHALTAEAVLDRLASSGNGLSRAEADRRRPRHPERAERAEPGIIRASAEELANPLTPALASGAWLAAASGSITDAALIGAFMGANALVSGVQRVSVGRALGRLIDESAVRVRVRRQRGEVLTTADQLVAGDVIAVQAGDAIPADCRVLTASGLELDESSLTGESQLVAKGPEPTGAANVAERHSMIYAGSSVAAGSGTAVVVAVGPATELGRSMQATEEDRRPGGVQSRLARLTSITVPVVLGAGAAVIGAGLLRGRPLSQTLGTGVSLAVAAVPEGLPIVATAAQYSAARRLSRRNALVRNPGTIEALGRVDVLCFDKTGTLTQGRIRLHRVWAGGAEQPLDRLTPSGRAALAAGLRAMPEHRNGERLAHATDRAVADGGAAAGVTVELGAAGWTQTGELPFEPSRGYHAVLGGTAAGQRLAVKGAVETVLPLCATIRRGSATVPLDDAARQAVIAAAERFGRRGYRVLAVAERDASSRRDLRADRITGLRFAGLLGLTDPVRDTAAAAVRELREAGIGVKMLTGDQPSTAAAIAGDLDLLAGRRVVTGPDLDRMSDDELESVAVRAAVFARVSPEHKVRIVAALRRAGKVVAVTGDGANDAPAIRLADVGVALGLHGTNAAKQAADVVVTDDRIETITAAIAEGRAMWASVRDAIAMLLGGNLGEVAFTVGGGLLLPGGSPLNARQLLLVNLLTDMVPSLALAVQRPRAATADVLLREGPEVSLGTVLTRDIMIRGGLTAVAGLAAWAGGAMTGVSPRRAGTVALVGLVGAQLGQTLAAGWRSPLVVGASVGSAAVLAAVIQTPGVSHFFGCRPLGPVGWSIGLSAAAAAGLGAPVASRIADRVAAARPERG
ncbi:MAG: HAD-IC family P-type ATPase, partial [Streptosporangiaceae bacterium]